MAALLRVRKATGGDTSSNFLRGNLDLCRWDLTLLLALLAGRLLVIVEVFPSMMWTTGQEP